MGRVALVAPLAILLGAGGCKAASEPAIARETVACDGVPQMAMTGRVTDAAEILTGEEEARLSDRLARYEMRTKHQMVIATTSSLHGARVDNFGTCLGERWEIGRQDHDDGIVILVAPKEQQMRIATGLGMEKILTDDKALAVIHEMIPQFKMRDYAGGLSTGIDAIAAQTGDTE
ncbi:TPM domain-containing protein [Sphingopyxis sp.]|uniref:TPM domain-containing protein n=1 Tax=Sphingopyxis sp. TaxID=1908224 RepID=UPI002D788D8B|nr:TPM domain-containing protein [Sphingopyxis sp.]HET6524954.1 TPM domain-containing protein [Sphingopyxis sp.]